jgi:hypothetical protein
VHGGSRDKVEIFVPQTGWSGNEAAGTFILRLNIFAHGIAFRHPSNSQNGTKKQFKSEIVCLQKMSNNKTKSSKNKIKISKKFDE